MTAALVRPFAEIGPSDDPAFAAWLVDQGIDSISVTPDSVLAVLRQFEQR